MCILLIIYSNFPTKTETIWVKLKEVQGSLFISIKIESKQLNNKGKMVTWDHFIQWFDFECHYEYDYIFKIMKEHWECFEQGNSMHSENIIVAMVGKTDQEGKSLKVRTMQ